MSEETQTTERAAPVETVGDIMSEATRATIKKMVLFLSTLVYVTAIVYAEVHGLSQLQAGVKPDMRIWAMLGMIAAGVSAICFPLALKSWCFDSMHRTMCTIFYVLDFAFLAFNAFTDFNVQTGQQLAGWAQSYLYYVLPASPLIVGAMWAILWELDPSTRAHVMRQTLKSAIIVSKFKQVANAAKRQTVTAQVEAAADREVESALTELFGTPVTIRDPHRYEQAIPQPTQAELTAQAHKLGMWNPNDPNDSPFWRTRPDVHEALTKPTDKLAHPKSIISWLGDDPAAYYDPSSKYALPCGHAAGATWNPDTQAEECNVCGMDHTAYFHPERTQEAGDKPSPFPGQPPE